MEASKIELETGLLYLKRQINEKHEELKKARADYYDAIVKKYPVIGKCWRIKDYITSDYTYMYVTEISYSFADKQFYIQGLGFTASFTDFEDDTYYNMAPDMRIVFPEETFEQFMADPENMVEISETEFLLKFDNITKTNLVDAFKEWYQRLTKYFSENAK